MRREIVLDTETTGFDPEEGHRIIEIGCVELENHIPTGRHLQLYINPERDVPQEAVDVHGITNEFLKDKPVFSQVFDEFVAFIGEGHLVIHNAEFDMKFINAELVAVGHPPIGWNKVIDTLQMARTKFPGSPANLDALCRRFGIDNTERTHHGALLDSELLAGVYLELLGGRQHGLTLAQKEEKTERDENTEIVKEYRETRKFSVSAAEQEAHKKMLQKINKPLWLAQQNMS